MGIVISGKNGFGIPLFLTFLWIFKVWVVQKSANTFVYHFLSVPNSSKNLFIDKQFTVGDSRSIGIVVYGQNVFLNTYLIFYEFFEFGLKITWFR